MKCDNKQSLIIIKWFVIKRIITSNVVNIIYVSSFNTTPQIANNDSFVWETKTNILNENPKSNKEPAITDPQLKFTILPTYI